MLILNKKRFVKILSIALIIISLLNIKSFAIVSPTYEFYVNDYANLLTEETKNYIINTNVNLQNQTGAQIVVVTVKNLEGDSLEEYATELFRSFGIGDKNKNNGILMLLALEEREFRIEVGYGLEGALPDAKSGRIQDEYIIPYLSQDNWDQGIKSGFDALVSVVAQEYNIDIETDTKISMNNLEIKDVEGLMLISIWGNFAISYIIKALISKFSKDKKSKSKKIITLIYLPIIFLLNFAFANELSLVINLTFMDFIVFFCILFGTASGRILWRRLFKWRLFKWRTLKRWRF